MSLPAMNSTMSPCPPMGPPPPASPNTNSPGSPYFSAKYTAQGYAASASLGIFVWDIVLNLPQDFKLATRHKINFPFIVYCTSRISSLIYLLGVLVATFAPINDCSVIQKLTFIYPVAIPSTLLLFVLRVCALYRNSKYAIAFFSSLWIGLLVSSIIMPFGTSAYKISSNGPCLVNDKNYAYDLADLPPLVHDTIIFFATSWVFLFHSHEDFTLKNGLKVLVFGKFLPALSKSILRDGQLYYLSILLLNIVLIIVYQRHDPVLTSCTFAFPLFVLMNILAGHVYRNLRFKVYMDPSMGTSVINKDLKRMMGSDDTSGMGVPQVAPIVFQRSVTTTSTRRHSLHFTDINSLRSEVGRLDLEKQGGEV